MKVLDRTDVARQRTSTATSGTVQQPQKSIVFCGKFAYETGDAAAPLFAAQALSLHAIG